MFGLASRIAVGYCLASRMIKGEKENREKNIPLPSFKGIIEVRHFLPGRMRIYVSKLVGNDIEKNLLEAQFSKIDGIDEIKVSCITGSVLLSYDASKVDAAILYSAMIRLLQLEELIDEKELSLVSKEIKQASESLNRGLFEKTGGIIDVKTAVPVSFIIFALREIYKNPSAGKPGAYTLLWWAYDMLRRGEVK